MCKSKSRWFGVIILLLVCRSDAQDTKPLEGILVRSPDAFSTKNLYLSTDGNPVSPDLVKLVFPGGNEVTKLMCDFIDQKVRLQGIMEYQKNVPTKTGKKINRRVVQVRKVWINNQSDKNKQPKFIQQVMGKTATKNGRWLSIDYQNGLWWIDVKRNLHVRLCAPVKNDERSAINRTATCKLSPDEKTLFVRQGLSQNFVRLPEMEIVNFSPREKRGLQLFRGFSPDSKYVVLHHSLGKLPSGNISVYSLETGGLVVNHLSTGEPRYGETGFYSSGKKFFVESAGTITLYEIPSGKKLSEYSKREE